MDGLRGQALWDPEDTGKSKLLLTLGQQWKTIRDEALASTEDSPIIGEGGMEGMQWSSSPLCQASPATCHIASALSLACPQCVTRLKMLEPGYHPRPTCGPDNARLTVYLPLVIGKSSRKLVYIYKT